MAILPKDLLYSGRPSGRPVFLFTIKRLNIAARFRPKRRRALYAESAVASGRIADSTWSQSRKRLSATSDALGFLDTHQ